jgi:hypothetical protein
MNVPDDPSFRLTLTPVPGAPPPTASGLAEAELQYAALQLAACQNMMSADMIFQTIGLQQKANLDGEEVGIDLMTQMSRMDTAISDLKNAAIAFAVASGYMPTR